MKFFSEEKQSSTIQSPDLIELLLTRFYIIEINTAKKFISKPLVNNETDNDQSILQNIRNSYQGRHDVEAILETFKPIIAIKKLIQEACRNQWPTDKSKLKPHRILVMADDLFGTGTTQDNISQKIKEHMERSTSEILACLDQIESINTSELQNKLIARFPSVDAVKLCESLTHLREGIERLNYHDIPRPPYARSTDDDNNHKAWCTIS